MACVVYPPHGITTFVRVMRACEYKAECVSAVACLRRARNAAKTRHTMRGVPWRGFTITEGSMPACTQHLARLIEIASVLQDASSVHRPKPAKHSFASVERPLLRFAYRTQSSDPAEALTTYTTDP